MLASYDHVVTGRTLQDLIGTPHLGKRGITDEEKEKTSATDEVLLDHFKEFKYVGLFFSANWCPPCKLMLKELKNFYTDINMEDKKMEIIYIPLDKDMEDCKGIDGYK
jgi:thiol-disulfide isomerase/thioredoxin